MKLIIQGSILFVMMTLLTGVLYPLVVTGIGQLAFSSQANGSLVKRGDAIVGSELIAQKFADKKYFWPRPSAGDFATVSSAPSNLGPTNASLRKRIDDQRASWAKANGVNPNTVPQDMLTTSGSGVDPHISVDGALMQVLRVAKSRGFDVAQTERLKKLVDENIESRQMGVFGDPRVNVLILNAALDDVAK